MQITNPSVKQPPPQNHNSLSLITPCASQPSPKDQTNKWADCAVPEGHKIGAISYRGGGGKKSRRQNTLCCADFQKSFS